MAESSVALLLPFPAPGAADARNDALIKAAVAAAQTRLVVLLAAPDAPADGHPPAGPAAVRRALGEVYNRVWDEACDADKVLLDCVVVPAALPGVPAPAAVLAAEAPAPVLLLGLDAEAPAALAPLAAEYRSLAPEAARAVFPGHLFLEADDGHTHATVCVGGTFDNLHFGHRKLLTLAASLVAEGGRLVVGVSEDALLQSKKLRELIEPVEQRGERVRAFVQALRGDVRVELYPISDPFGPSIVEPDIDAIIVSSETARGGEAINARRAEAGMAPLAVYVTRRTDASTLSSTFIREKLAERGGGGSSVASSSSVVPGASSS